MYYFLVTIPSKYRASYTADDLINAIAAVKNDSMSMRQASERFNVPNTTLWDRIHLGVTVEKPEM